MIMEEDYNHTEDKGTRSENRGLQIDSNGSHPELDPIRGKRVAVRPSLVFWITTKNTL